MLTGCGIEHEDGPLESPEAVGAAVIGRGSAETEVDEKGLATVMQSAVRENIANIVERQIALRQAPIGMLGYHGDPWFSHRSDPPKWSGPTLDSWSLVGLLATSDVRWMYFPSELRVVGCQDCCGSPAWPISTPFPDRPR